MSSHYISLLLNDLQIFIFISDFIHIPDLYNSLPSSCIHVVPILGHIQVYSLTLKKTVILSISVSLNKRHHQVSQARNQVVVMYSFMSCHCLLYLLNPVYEASWLYFLAYLLSIHFSPKPLPLSALFGPHQFFPEL